MRITVAEDARALELGHAGDILGVEAHSDVLHVRMRLSHSVVPVLDSVALQKDREDGQWCADRY